MSLLVDALSNAPADPAAALVHVEASLPIDVKYENQDYIEIVNFFVEFTKRYNLVLKDIYDLDDVQVGAHQVDESSQDRFVLWCSKIRANAPYLLKPSLDERVDSMIEDFDKKLDNSKRYDRFGRANFSVSEKEALRTHLDHVRGIIDRSPLPDRKKNALFARLSELQQEVDRAGTKTDAFFAFWADLSLTVGEMAENAKPAIEETKQILRIVLSRRAEDEGAKLDAASRFLAIEDSREQGDGEIK